MVKRSAQEDEAVVSPSKRQRIQSDAFSSLSDELLLRIFSNLSVQELNLCQRVSPRFCTIGGDSQLWRAAYYDRFMRPRLARANRRKSSTSQPISKLARWLDEGDLIRRGASTNWKRQYKTRHNWSKGTCNISEIPVAVQPPVPAMLARLQDGIIYTADARAGLRAWSYRGERKLLACIPLVEGSETCSAVNPTAIAVTTPIEVNPRIAIGFTDGSFGIFAYDRLLFSFRRCYSHPKSSNGAITALALSSTYMLCMTHAQVLSLYQFPSPSDHPSDHPILLNTLRSQTAWPPLSLSIRPRGLDILASIAFCMPTFPSGWSSGIQELLFAADGSIIESRLASATGQGFTSLVRDPLPLDGPSESSPMRVSSPQCQVQSKPTSVSYSHPYLLASHSDNTMSLYMVTSTSVHLSISPGKRLWGHTSSIFNAQVGGRGKAISVSARGDEIRVWELEGGLTRRGSSGAETDEVSIQITSEKRLVEPYGRKTSLPQKSVSSAEVAITCGWVGFDDESVVVIREQEHGSQALTVFDFS
jgi:hypothetical protein